MFEKNVGTRVPVPLVITRYFEREAYLSKQRPQTHRDADVVAVVMPNGELGLMSYPQVHTQRIKVIKHPLNFNHLFPEEQLMDVILPAVPPGLSLNESFNHRF